MPIENLVERFGSSETAKCSVGRIKRSLSHTHGLETNGTGELRGASRHTIDTGSYYVEFFNSISAKIVLKRILFILMNWLRYLEPTC